MQTPDVLFITQINRLIAINNERFKTYSRAMEKTHDSTFRSLCAQAKERTVYFNMQLIRCLVQHDLFPGNTDTGLGKAYHFGMIFRLGLLHRMKGVNRNACSWWDSIALKAYRQVLTDLQHIPQEIKRVILQQQSILESEQLYANLSAA
jgi:hypothetical protein